MTTFWSIAHLDGARGLGFGLNCSLCFSSLLNAFENPSIQRLGLIALHVWQGKRLKVCQHCRKQTRFITIVQAQLRRSISNFREHNFLFYFIFTLFRALEHTVKNPKPKYVCLFYEEKHLKCTSIINAKGGYKQLLWTVLHEKQQDELPLPTAEFN